MARPERPLISRSSKLGDGRRARRTPGSFCPPKLSSTADADGTAGGGDMGCLWHKKEEKD